MHVRMELNIYLKWKKGEGPLTTSIANFSVDRAENPIIQ